MLIASEAGPYIARTDLANVLPRSVPHKPYHLG